jgi:hypothetical protein
MTNKDTKYFKEDKAIGLNENLLIMLDRAREEAGIKFPITSGLRTHEENIKAGGVYNSAHLKGEAVDILCENNTQRFYILKGAILAGFKRIEIAEKHIHLDIDKTKPQDIIFFPK